MKYRVFRGGSYYLGIGYLRSTFRFRDEPEIRRWGTGFRLVVICRVRRKP